MFDVLRIAPLYDVDKRLLFRGGKWLVRTREIAELGPFYSRLEAVEGLYRHVAICTGQLRTAEPGLAREFARHSAVDCATPDCMICAALQAMVPAPTCA